MPIKLGCVVVLVVVSIRASGADNWPRWRGPADNGSNEAGKYVAKFDDQTGVLWKVELPGKGCSTPIVWDKRVVVTAPVDGQDAALAYDWDGKPLWRTKIGPESKGKHRNGSGSNPSPATDGRLVFVSYKSGHLAALELATGKLLWKTNLVERYGKDTLYWDYGTSPVLTADAVVVALMRNGNSVVVAFDKQSGEPRWNVARDYKTPTENDHSYATPIVVKHQGKEAVVVWGAEHLTAHAADDGRLLWSCGDFNPQGKANWVAVSSFVVVDDVAVVPYGRGSALHGVRLGGNGDVTASHRAWKRDGTGTFVPTPAAYKGCVYLVRDNGGLECVDPKTGRTVWKDALPKGKDSYYSSPSIADDKIYAAREDGVIHVVKIPASDGKPELLSSNDMKERVIASPVPIHDRLLIRGERHLFCVGER